MMHSPVKTNNLKVTSYYGNRTYTYRGKKVSDFHNGIDLVGGTDIIAFEDGVVTGLCNKGEQYGTACYVRLKHSNGWYTLYYHLKSGSVCVTKGQTVKKGDKLGIMGATGIATGVHLHFQIDKGNSSSTVNPYDYIFNDKELVPTPTPTPTPTGWPKTYTVVKGDTLSGIAKKFYGNGGAKYYNYIASANGISNPNIIHTGQVLTIPEYK